MSAKERNAAIYRLHEGLEYWHERWQLVGQCVICPGCQAQQLAKDAQTPFVHVDGCSMASDFAKFPWLELRDHLRGLPAVPA